jgi:hypothetical protein
MIWKACARSGNEVEKAEGQLLEDKQIRTERDRI